MNRTLMQEIAAGRILVCDGAMGTELVLSGLAHGECGEAWNLSHADQVLAIQRRYVEAGADCLITNTFGANRIILSRQGLEKELLAINRAGAEIARRAFGAKPGFVLGDMGPLGALLEPYGELSAEKATAALEEQAAALVGSGVDAVIIETQTALEELGLAIDAAKKAGAPCVIASLAYDLMQDTTSYRTMMGVSPEQAAKFIGERGADIVALNCGTGMDMQGAARVARIYGSSCSLPVMVQPNAGRPVMENNRAVYRQGPADMGRDVPAALEAGVAILGSCCGSTPEHTREIRRRVDLFR
jgi:5-methyltetrahydrofolate--homocysteine methyltransferase